MKKTTSAPNLPSLAQPPQISPCLGSQLKKRSVSVNALHTLEDIASPAAVIYGLINEIQVESVLHVPAIVKGQCALNYPFPDSLLHSVSTNQELSEDMKEYASCIATPLEHEEIRLNVGSGRVGSAVSAAMNNNPDLMERYSRILSSIRRSRRRKSDNVSVIP